ncbi:type I-E CRISPR-associated protein Cas7/Cse4/CasC [Xenorhabdus sp. Vera]|uniref:type I-E CRISPR-associated protein Cas7/Cse4/CasC n=1 Tax=Xenorhabdus koppenhoeferi TaxID=351659 RepID=UPI0019AE999A|nr:type I-E CRISPR-associated protein Cas7/Cse4/CasC [Xenorhabdus sp. Vera]MBD2809417.1 type I-E CRISPR-associated protein Cas7/Cse4/CasC [Xenorhabdus sp. Vera]
MSQFIQLHLLTSYPPANLNRDDLGRPKTAKMGGAERLRISSQSLKRHWRISDLFQAALAEHLGFRTKRFGFQVYQRLLNGGVKEKQALEWATAIAEVFGKNKKDEPLEIEQLAHISPKEKEITFALADKLIAENRAPTKEELQLLSREQIAVDMALFGRMLASSPAYSVEAACQVAHAISVHSIAVENDYFTAVDDLNHGKSDSGSAHIGEAGFAAALFYNYICINKSLLLENLAGNEALANKAIAALVEAAVKVAPSGKQNSFGSRAYASYVLAEKGEYQPRSLSVAFLKPIEGEDQANSAILALKNHVENFDKVYGACADTRYSISAVTGEGSFAELVQFVTD